MFGLFGKRILFDTDGGAGGGDDDDTPTLTGWIEGLEDAAQKETVQGLLDAHVGKLQSALSSERESRKGLEKQVRDLAKAAEDGSDSQAQLNQLADNLAEAGKKTDFYEAAHAAGATNLKLAYMAAVQDDLFDRKGQVNFDELKKNYPELFGAKKGAAGNAGEGTGDNPPEGKTMNEFIRRAAGR